ncbi:hypothetical protein F5Y10DRAFT_273792 [Nemania abortiva]|nr:hypothetical protein F5Y10DRAFT_273792 [Nemania abortiva]
MADSASAFPLFANLPKELRLRIWACTLSPRIFRIGLGPGSKSAIADWSPSANPVALRVCAESRAEALRYLSLSVFVYQFHSASALRFAKRYIDPDADILAIDARFGRERDSAWGRINGDFRQLMSILRTLWPAADGDGRRTAPRARRNVRRVALPGRWWRSRWTEPEELGVVANHFFRELREIFILPDPYPNSSAPEEQPSAESNAVAEGEDKFEALLSLQAREILTDLGWEVQTREDGLEIAKPESKASTRIRHCPPELARMIDRVPLKPSPEDTFFKRDPDVEYPDGRTCMPGPTPRRNPATLTRRPR